MGKVISDPSKEKTSGFWTAVYVVVIGIILIVALSAIEYLPVAIIGLAVVFMLATLRIQLWRYRNDNSRNNLYPLLGYVFLVFGGIGLILHRLPETNIVSLRRLTLDYSTAWILFIVLFFIGFLFLGMWSWHFIKLRPFLRTYVVFLTVALLVSSLGSLVFTLLTFQIVEDNNLLLMKQGAQTEQLITVDRSNTAIFVGKTISEDKNFVSYLAGGQTTKLNDRAEEYLNSSGIDFLRVYNKSGEVVSSPDDARDEGRMLGDDLLVSFALNEAKHVKSFDTRPGVLSDSIITRAVHPIVDNAKVIGAVETGYVFDNAFVDFSKEKTGLDVTVYTGAERSATTIQTLNGVSRWVGSQETEANVLNKVLANGQSHEQSVERLGRLYYSAFIPVRNVNGEIIGMVSVGTPTEYLFEDTRQQLISTFLILSLMSLIVSLAGYLVIHSFRKQNLEA